MSCTRSISLRVENVSLFHFICVISSPQSQVAEKGRELKELKDTLALVLKEKEKLEGVGDTFHFLFFIGFFHSKNSLKCAIPLQFSLAHSGLFLLCL